MQNWVKTLLGQVNFSTTKKAWAAMLSSLQPIQARHIPHCKDSLWRCILNISISFLGCLRQLIA